MRTMMEKKELRKQVEKKKPLQIHTIPRVPTGIPGLDEMMEGGFEKNSINLITGEAGTGKSISALQFINHGAVKYNDTCLYITFEEKKDNILQHTRRFGWDLADLERRNKLFIYEYSPREVDKFTKDGGSIERMVRNNNIDRIVFDSITSFAVMYGSEQKRRESIIQLLETLRKWKVTTLLTSEATILGGAGETRAKFGIEYLADSLLAIYSIRKGDIRERALEIVKMRGTAHSNRLAPLKITNMGITLYPDQPFFTKSF